MQPSLFYLRLTEVWHSPLAPPEVLRRVQRVTASDTALGGAQFRESAPLFQGWLKADSFRISLLSQGKNGRKQSSVVLEGKVLATDAGGSRLRLLYRPLLMQLFMLGFWLIFWGTGTLVSLLEWLRGPASSFAWQAVAVPCVIYGLTVFLFWRGSHRSRRRLIALLDLSQSAALPIA